MRQTVIWTSIAAGVLIQVNGISNFAAGAEAQGLSSSQARARLRCYAVLAVLLVVYLLVVETVKRLFYRYMAAAHRAASPART